MTEVPHVQNCVLCDEPGWLISGEQYDVMSVTKHGPNRSNANRFRMTIMIETHTCKNKPMYRLE